MILLASPGAPGEDGVTATLPGETTVRPMNLLAAVLLLLASPADARTPLPIHTRTYRFTARVTGNGGVSPFKVGALIHGTFTYDLRPPTRKVESAVSSYFQSPRNSLVLRVGELRFAASGAVGLNIYASDNDELFWLFASDLELPSGWEVGHHKGKRQVHGLVLKNAPPRKVLRPPTVPARIRLADFMTRRELTLNFNRGVRFPGGEVAGQAIVVATVELLD
jgi:hypothetical protein